MPIPLSYCTRSLWKRWPTTAATALGVGLVAFVLAASQMLSSGVRATLLRAGSDTRAIVMQQDAYAEIDSRMRQSALTAASAAPGVARGRDGQPLVSGESLVQVFVPRIENDSVVAVQVRGVGENVFAVRPEVRITSGRPPYFGSDEAIIGSAIAGTYKGLMLGGSLTLKKGRDVQIVGVFDTDGSSYDSEVWTGLDVVRTFMGWEGYLSTVTAVLESPRALDGFAAVIEADRLSGLTAIRERAYYEKVSEGLARSFTTVGDLISFIFALGAMLGAAITMNDAISRRRREIGVLRALGFSAPAVMVAFLVESALVALTGAALGIGAASVLSLGEVSTTNYGTGNQIAFPFELNVPDLMRALVGGAAVGVLGGFFPALRAARTDPTAAMRN